MVAILSKSKLAIDGGEPAVPAPIPLLNNIGQREAEAAYEAVLRGPLSGYLAGKRLGGYYVNELEERWAQQASAKYAVAVNSATSGILVAYMAAGVDEDTIVNCPAYTMSGSIAPAVILRGIPYFWDVDPVTYCLPDNKRYDELTMSVGLFGHEPYAKGRFIIQDNAQAFLAKHNNAAISVYSLNVHKQIQAGEGGICVTNDADLAYKMQMFRNHGENASYNVGLNLRMTEVTAAIALAQLEKADWIMSDRVSTAEAMTKMVNDVPWLRPPTVLDGCTHSYYIWALHIGKDRLRFVNAMQAEGVPLRVGYSTPLHQLLALAAFNTNKGCPTVEELEDKTLITYENCAYNPSGEQLKQYKQAFEKVCEHADSWT